MRYFVIAFAVGSLACFGGTVQHYRIPNTPDGAQCARECKTQENTCLAARAAEITRERVCDEQLHQCRATCPGAQPT